LFASRASDGLLVAGRIGAAGGRDVGREDDEAAVLREARGVDPAGELRLLLRLAAAERQEEELRVARARRDERERLPVRGEERVLVARVAGGERTGVRPVRIDAPERNGPLFRGPVVRSDGVDDRPAVRGDRRLPDGLRAVEVVERERAADVGRGGGECEEEDGDDREGSGPFRHAPSLAAH
jgi:hypothetical protein